MSHVMGTVMVGVSQACVSACGTCQHSVKRENLEGVPREDRQDLVAPDEETC